MQNQELHRALEEWLIGLVRSGQEEGCKGALMLLIFGDGQDRRAEVVAALPEGTTREGLAVLVHELAEEIKSGGGMPLGRDGRTIPGQEGGKA